MDKNNDNQFYLKLYHSIDYFEHNYIRMYKIKYDYVNLGLNEIKKKLSNYKYRFNILKEIALRNESLNSNPLNLKEFFLNLYGDIKLKFDNIKNSEKNFLVEKIRKEFKLTDIDVTHLDNYITLDYQCLKIINYIKNKKHKTNYLHNLIIDIKYENIKILKLIYIVTYLIYKI